MQISRGLIARIKFASESNEQRLCDCSLSDSTSLQFGRVNGAVSATANEQLRSAEGCLFRVYARVGAAGERNRCSTSSERAIDYNRSP